MLLGIADCPRGRGRLDLLPVVLPGQRSATVKVKVPPTRGLTARLLQLVLDEAEVLLVVGGPEEGALDPVGPGTGLRLALIIRAALGYSPDVGVKAEHLLATRG